jgi:hypothetical protein
MQADRYRGGEYYISEGGETHRFLLLGQWEFPIIIRPKLVLYRQRVCTAHEMKAKTVVPPFPKKSS